MFLIMTITSRSFSTIVAAQMRLRPKIYNSHLVLEILAGSHGTDSHGISLFAGLGLPAWYASSHTLRMVIFLLVYLPLTNSVQPKLASFAIYCTAGVQPRTNGFWRCNWLSLFARPFDLPELFVVWLRIWLSPFARPCALPELFVAIGNICNR